MDDTLDPELAKDDMDEETDDDLSLGLGPKKGKVPKDDEDSLDALADEEELLLPEDRFDDVEPEDLW